jgi:hypothetical protein
VLQTLFATIFVNKVLFIECRRVFLSGLAAHPNAVAFEVAPVFNYAPRSEPVGMQLQEFLTVRLGSYER